MQHPLPRTDLPVVQFDHTFLDSLVVLSLYSVIGMSEQPQCARRSTLVVQWAIKKIARLGFGAIRLRTDADVSTKCLMGSFCIVTISM